MNDESHIGRIEQNMHTALPAWSIHIIYIYLNIWHCISKWHLCICICNVHVCIHIPMWICIYICIINICDSWFPVPFCRHAVAKWHMQRTTSCVLVCMAILPFCFTTLRNHWLKIFCAAAGSSLRPAAQAQCCGQPSFTCTPACPRVIPAAFYSL